MNTRVPDPRRSLGLKLRDTRVYAPQIRALLGSRYGSVEESEEEYDDNAGPTRLKKRSSEPRPSEHSQHEPSQVLDTSIYTYIYIYVFFVCIYI